MKVRIPHPLRSYTGGCAEVDATGATLAELVADLERAFTGIRFRIVDEQDGVRTHIRFFVNEHMALALSHPLAPADTVMIVCALSGG